MFGLSSLKPFIPSHLLSDFICASFPIHASLILHLRNSFVCCILTFCTIISTHITLFSGCRSCRTTYPAKCYLFCRCTRPHKISQPSWKLYQPDTHWRWQTLCWQCTNYSQWCHGHQWSYACHWCCFNSFWWWVDSLILIKLKCICVFFCMCLIQFHMERVWGWNFGMERWLTPEWTSWTVWSAPTPTYIIWAINRRKRELESWSFSWRYSLSLILTLVWVWGWGVVSVSRAC